MSNSSTLATVLGGWANSLPAVWRKRIYQTVKVLAGVATLALIVLPYLPQFGVNWSGQEVAVTALTAALAFLGHLAAANTHTDPLVDVTPAPEPGDVAPPEGQSDPAANDMASGEQPQTGGK